jgi:signal peptidase II
MQAARGKTLTGVQAGPTGPAGVAARPPGRPRRIGLLLAVAATVFVVDLAAKAIVVATLSHRPPVRLLGGLLTLRVLRNSGAAFSIGTSMTAVFTLIAVAVIISILRTSRRLRSLPWAITLGLLLGGATGNLGDRLFRSPGPLRGYVVDWIQLPHWPVFNVADSAIVCGGILAVLLAARGVRLDGTRDRPGKHPGDGPGGRPGGGAADGTVRRTPGAAEAGGEQAPGTAAGGSGR